MQNREFLSIRGLTIVPCVNPDGTEIALHGSDAAFKYKPLVEKVCTDTYKWQANARGVDINHNFNAGWCRLKQLELKNNIKCPAPTRFGGNHPESEPETKALTTLCRNIDLNGQSLCTVRDGKFTAHSADTHPF